jgi:TolB-like protein/DNA-binding winged helix-turn-helix (wHTH) protein/Tfp pilus assembly protein PilF
MSPDPNRLAFGPFILDPNERALTRDGQAVPLTAKAFDVLHLLVRKAGRTVTKEEFMAAVWSGTIVEEANLTDNISTLRQALGDDAREPRYVQTVPKRGYRFVAEVRAELETPASRPRTLWLAAAAVILVAIGTAAVLLWPRRVAPAPKASAPRSLAVLPFRPLTASDRDAALEAGMADALITKLSRVRGITVRPTASVMPFANRDTDLREIATKLEVDSLLEGRLQRSGDRLRVTVQLVRAADGATLWADHFDERFTDVFAVQDAISERVANVLALKLTAAERDVLGRRPTENVEAYQLYLNGYHQWRTFNTDGLLASINYFNAALKLDPRFALAWTGLGRAYSVLGIYGPLDERDAFPKAQAAIAKALELDPSLPDAHVVNIAVKTFYEHDWDGVKRELDLVDQLDPSNSEAPAFRGYWLKAMGRPDEAIAAMDRSLQRAPEWSIAKNDAVLARVDARRYDEAIAMATKAIALDSGQTTMIRMLAFAYAGKGDYENAVRTFERYIALSKRNKSRGLAGLAWTFAKMGQREKALALIEELKREDAPWTSYELAKVYAGLGDRDQAFFWLDRALEERVALMFDFRSQFVFDGIRDDPRFKDVLRALNMPV